MIFKLGLRNSLAIKTLHHPEVGNFNSVVDCVVAHMLSCNNGRRVVFFLQSGNVLPLLS